jgi:hypothetical protein
MPPSMPMPSSFVDNWRQNQITSYSFFFLPYPLSGVSTSYFSSCCDKDSAIILTTGYLSDMTLLETGMGANDCKCS